MRLKNKVALITGAGRGIGRSIALGFAAEGAHTLLMSRTLADVEAVAAEARALGRDGFQPRSIAVAGDVAVEADVKATVKAALEEYGRVDVLVNNAGAATTRPVWGTPLSSFERIVAVNLTGCFIFTKELWKPMKQAGGGSIINISSMAGTHGVAMLSAYCASKWGQVGFTKACAEEGKADNIRANVLAPGKGDTAMRAAIHEDKTKMLTADDHIGAAVFLASDESRYITGQVIEIDWFG